MLQENAPTDLAFTSDRDNKLLKQNSNFSFSFAILQDEVLLSLSKAKLTTRISSQKYSNSCAKKMKKIQKTPFLLEHKNEKKVLGPK